jgi:hypothetical protein
MTRITRADAAVTAILHAIRIALDDPELRAALIGTLRDEFADVARETRNEIRREDG